MSLSSLISTTEIFFYSVGAIVRPHSREARYTIARSAIRSTTIALAARVLYFCSTDDRPQFVKVGVHFVYNKMVMTQQ